MQVEMEKSLSQHRVNSSCAEMHVLIKYSIKQSSYQTTITSSGNLLLALRLSPLSGSPLEGASRCTPGAKHSSLLAHRNLHLTLVITAVPQPWSTLFAGLVCGHFVMLCHKHIIFQLHLILQLFPSARWEVTAQRPLQPQGNPLLRTSPRS